jgi:unsaturated rhamnogalacturonyl hydrolase
MLSLKNLGYFCNKCNFIAYFSLNNSFTKRHNMKITWIAVFIALISCATTSLFAIDPVPYSQRMANSQMSRSGTLLSWDYPNGLFAESVLKVYELYKTEKYISYVTNHANATINTSTGKIAFYNFTDYTLDNINPGKFLFELNKLTPKPQYKIALDTLRKQLQQQPRTNNTSDGGFWHKKVYPHQMWLDGLFMGTRFYAAYEKEYNNGAGYDDIVNQFVLIHSKTYDPVYQLNYHGWSALPSDANSFWANQTEPFLGCSKEFWGRGVGWYAAALVDVIEIMPTNYERRKELVEIFRQVAAGIKRWQDPTSGCWYQLLRYDGSFKSDKGKSNYLEASASSMFTYALLKAIRLGIVDSEVYKPVAVKAYNGLLTNFVTEDGSGNLSLNRICRSAGLGPSTNPARDGSASYYLDGSDAGSIVSNDLKGVGPFILASVEYEILQNSETESHSQLFDDQKVDLRVFQNFISIESAQNIEQVKVFNYTGVLMKTVKGDRNKHLEFSQTLPNGIYLLLIKFQFPCGDKIYKRYLF